MSEMYRRFVLGFLRGGVGMLATAVTLVAAGAGGGAPVVGWDRLAGFAFEAPAYAEGQDDATVVAESRRQIPAEIAALDRSEVVVTGYMMPVRMQDGNVAEFLLVSDPMVCCFGADPKVNEWITVRLAEPVAAQMDVPLAFRGELRVGPVLDNGYLTTIYAMENARRETR